MKLNPTTKPNFEKEKQRLERLLQKDPQNVSLLDQLAFVYLKINQSDEAEKLLEQALICSPGLPMLLSHLGIAYLQNKNFSGAEICFKKVLESQKDDIEAMNNLSLALYSQQKREESLACLLAVLEVDAHHARARYLCGKILCEEKLYEEADLHFNYLVSFSEEALPNIIKTALDHDQLLMAKKYIEIFLAKNPDDVEMLYNLAVIESRSNLPLSAAHYYQTLLKIEPDNFSALNNLAVVYLEQNNIPAAKYFFERALVVCPQDVSVRYTLAAINGKQDYDQSPAEYVSELFDHYADHFEKHLVQGLGYETHRQLFELFDKNKPTDFKGKLDILDFGCGTGLCGALFKSFSKHLIGIDLSKNMLTIAEQKQCYDELVVMDGIQYLKEANKNFDLIIAADVFPYIGDLELLFSACLKSLTYEGYLLFSTEMTENEDFFMQKTGRFAHSSRYIEALARKNRMHIVDKARKTTRKQNNIQMISNLYLLRISMK